jgi:putative ABC transport system permease protein
VTLLTRKLGRDMARLRWQIASIAAVVACGVAMFLAALGTFEALQRARTEFYADTRFGDVFVHLSRAPDAVRERLVAIDGVASVETRLSFEVPLDLLGVHEPVSGRVVSLPPPDRAASSRLVIVSGRLPEPFARDEVVVNEAFALARGLVRGDRFHAVLDGRRELLTVVGTVLSAEHVSALRAGEILADDRHYGILWLSEVAVESAFRASGTFNEAVLRLAPGADVERVKADVDGILAAHGGHGAYDRSEQPAYRFVDSELRELEVIATVLPVLFLVVAAFLLNIVMARIVAQERAQIATLRALGFRVAPIARHYASLAAATALLGVVVGTVGGLALGRMMTQSYTQFFRFPNLAFAMDVSLAAVAATASLGAALLGALASVRRVARLPPAEAMQAGAAASFRVGRLERTRGFARLPPSMRLVVRNAMQRPARTLAGAAGVAVAMGVLVVGSFWGDAFDVLLHHQFAVVQREDAVVTFTTPQRDRAIRELAAIPGVRIVEGIRAVPVRIHVGPYDKRVELLGLPERSRLRRLVTASGAPVELPRHGLMISRHLAERLRTGIGERLTIDVLEGARQRHELVVTAIADEMLGMAAYLHADALARMLEEGPTVSAALLTVEPGTEARLHRVLADIPRVATVTMKAWVVRRFEATLMRVLVFFSWMLSVFGALVVAGVVYNSARVLLGERARDLVTLRVLGFTTADVSEAFLLELGAQIVVGLPLGMLVGYGFAAAAVQLFGPEDMSIPLVVGVQTWALAITVVIVAAVVSGWIVRRRLVHLDLLEGLKVRE